MVDEEGPKWKFLQYSRWKELLFSHSSSSNLHVYWWPFETPPQKIDLLCSRFTASCKVKTGMQENVKRIQSYQLDRPNFSMLFCSRENRQENVLDSTGSHGFEQNLNLKILARRKVFSSRTKIRGFFAKQGWDRSRNQKVGMKYFMLRLCPLDWWVQSYLATWCYCFRIMKSGTYFSIVPPPRAFPGAF